MVIRAPVGEVFAYIADPSNLVDWVTFLTHVHITSSEKIGPETCIACSMEVLGRKIMFDAVTNEYLENRVFSWKSEKHASFPMINRMEFSERGGETEVRWILEYGTRIPVIGKVTDMAFHNYFKHEMERSLDRLSREFESRNILKRLEGPD